MVLKVNILQDHWLFLFVYFSAFFALGYGRSCGYPGDILNGEMHAEGFLSGSTVYYTCNTGYNMISKQNYRVCEADGMWSNSVPICEAQICQPPNAIADGSYEPNLDEYEYQNSVKYQCNGKPPLALIGESVLFCTASGAWSSSAPECKVVECQPPNVLNAMILSGISGPYYFQHVVVIECKIGFKMNGSSLVKCNSNSLWNPPLPTCDRETVTKVPTTSKETTLTKESICDKIWQLQKEVRMCTSTPDEWIKYLQVHHLFLKIESLKLDIEIKKKQLG